MIVDLRRSSRRDKKWMVNFNNKTIHFGGKNMSDYTIHKDADRKTNYISRHAKMENWNRSGINTAGFWSKHLLWNKTSLRDSIKNIEKTFNINIIYKYG